MRHRKHRHTLGLTKEHRKATLGNLAMSLFQHGRIRTTLAKAKALRPFAEKLITKAKKAQSAPGETAIHHRRIVAQKLCGGSKRCAILQVLFGKVARQVEARPGGYTRILKLAHPRFGDAAEMALIEIIDEPCIPRPRAKEKTTQRVSIQDSSGRKFNNRERESRRMNQARDYSKGREKIRFVYPIPKLSCGGCSENGLVETGKPVEVRVDFAKGYREYTRDYVDRYGSPEIRKVGAAIELPSEIILEDLVYKETTFSHETAAPSLVFRVIPQTKITRPLTVHFFDQSEYRGSSEVRLPVQ